MKSIVMLLDSDAEYSEQEVNERLIRWNREIAPEIECDYVTLRRLLVDYGELERTADGGWYRMGFPARPVAFAMDIDELDLHAIVAAYRMEQARRRRPPA